MPRYKLTIAYDGTDFCGWQKQEPLVTRDDGTPIGAYSEQTPLIESTREGRVALRTVQGVVEQAARGVCREMVELVGSSRTDSGVHANGQVAAFTSNPGENGLGWPSERGAERLMMALNARLPEDVLIVSAEETHASFDPIADTVSKGYSYTFFISRTRPLWTRRTVTHVSHTPVDVGAMREAAKVLIGEHDFAAFAAAGHGRLSTVRTVHALDVRELPRTEGANGQLVRIDIAGSGFLWNMVRIIAGSLLQVGTGQRTAADLAAALASRDRSQAGPTARPEGLCLEWIKYT